MWWVIVVVVLIIALVNVIVYFFNDNNVITKHALKKRGCGALFISNRSSDTPRPQRPLRFFCWDVLDPRHQYTGCCGTLFLIVYRSLGLALVVADIILEGVDKAMGFDSDWLGFFTNITFVLYGLYSIYGIVLTSIRFVSQRRHAYDGKQPEWSVFDKVLIAGYASVAPASLALTAFYWAVLYDGDTLSADNPIKHGGSSVLLIFEAFFSRLPIVSYHIQFVISYGTLYLAFMWIYWGVTDYWFYEALDWTESATAIVYYIALPLLLVIMFLILYLVALLREALFFRHRKAAPITSVTAFGDPEAPHNGSTNH